MCPSLGLNLFLNMFTSWLQVHKRGSDYLGQAQVHVMYEGQQATLPMLVVSGDDSSTGERDKESPLYGW